MKNIINNISIISLIALLLGTTSCRDWLDIRPEGETVLEDYWQSESDAQQVLMACYRSLTEPGAIQHMMLWGELRSDNVISGLVDVPLDVTKVLELDINSTNSICLWGSMYTTINYCNTFLYYAPDVVDIDVNFSQAEFNAMKAEALTLRSLCYFYLVRTFKRVPYITTPSIDDTQDFKVEQAEEEAVLDSLVVDLTEALRYAPIDFLETVELKGRVTKNAVRALLADVYLWREEYDNCIAMCDGILDDENLELVESDYLYSSVFGRGNSTESIFELQFEEDQIENTTTKEYYGNFYDLLGFLTYPNYLLLSDDENQRDSSPFGYEVSSTVVESENDIRLRSFVRESELAGINFIFKYAGNSVILEDDKSDDEYNYRLSSPNWILYRLPDVILMKAEALTQRNAGGDLKAAVELVNQTYLRANPDLGNDSLLVEDYVSKSEVEQLVLRERQRELMFEGKRWFDLVRLARRSNSTKPLLNYVTIKYSSAEGMQDNKLGVMDALYLPIHRNEITSNDLLEQNPFYEITGSSSSSSN